jgi:hypothetical protein
VSKTLVASGRISTYSTDPQEANKPFNTEFLRIIPKIVNYTTK